MQKDKNDWKGKWMARTCKNELNHCDTSACRSNPPIQPKTHKHKCDKNRNAEKDTDNTHNIYRLLGEVTIYKCDRNDSNDIDKLSRETSDILDHNLGN